MYKVTFFLESAFQIISSSLVLLKFDSVRAQMQKRNSSHFKLHDRCIRHWICYI